MGGELFRVSAARSHRGAVRKVNEDACLELPADGLWVVADGMGGHHAGDYASQLTVQSLRDVGEHASLGEFVGEVERRLLEVNAQLIEEAGDDGNDTMMGCTVVALLAYHHLLAFMWAGDSRAYRLRGGRLKQLTRDHSEVEDLIARGEIERADAETHPAANVITRAIGALDQFDTLEVGMSDIRPDDRYLLCSDGLYRVVQDEEIAGHLAEFEPDESCARLIELALARQCADNVTVVCVAFGGQN